MKKQQLILVVVNVLGGIAVLGSYAHGIITHPDSAGALWGDVPMALMPYYRISMIAAALGYLAFTWFVVFRLSPGKVRIAGRFPYGMFSVLYILVLAPSALWMPLSFMMIEAPSMILWCAIRGVLSLTGLASLGLLAVLITLDHQKRSGEQWVAIIGCVFFCVQTAVLDALVWTAYFPRNF